MLNLSGVIQQPGVPLTPEEIAQVEAIRPIPGKDGLYLIGGFDGQAFGGAIAVLVTDEGVAMVDDKFTRKFEDIIKNIRTVTNQPIKYVISSHHHGDHTGGNVLFTEVAEMVMHKNARANMIKGNQGGPGDITFVSEGGIWLGGVEIQMHHFGRGHTDGDTITYFPSLKTIHTGDLILKGQRSDGSTLTPLWDMNNGGSLLEWPATLDGVLSLDFDTAILGHGHILDKSEVKAFRDQMALFIERMTAYVKAGKSKDSIVTDLDMTGIDWPAAGGFSRNLLTAYDEIEASLK